MTSNKQEKSESLKLAIREAGLRATPARIATLRLLHDATSPLTHAEVAEELQKRIGAADQKMNQAKDNEAACSLQLIMSKTEMVSGKNLLIFLSCFLIKKKLKKKLQAKTNSHISRFTASN